VLGALVYGEHHAQLVYRESAELAAVGTVAAANLFPRKPGLFARATAAAAAAASSFVRS